MTTRLYTFTAVAFLAGLYFLWHALQFPGSHEVSTLVGPRTWPLGVLVLMLALIAAMAVMLWVGGPEQFTGEPEDKIADPSQETPDAAVVRDKVTGQRWRHLVILGLTLGYTLVMSLTGYLIATALFAAGATVVLGERRPLRILLNTAIAALIVSVVFDRLLHIPLP
ncbi:tripartite tricarboxylate transporter TctB family protein [Yangia mangrovi]|uniref:Tripartite tricarboxylate transporter TctB family protein n=1 Tax=Alloyangia mangrovi TaxID=1779329 RepID=A0A2A3JX62_9RHOB|nr:tripartite tricarboxylate transporter TctB family protein [Alloyangia mangrovi]MCT4373343.1 tripartite tricarboxylate transporter TctB family protein [Alloyangia mangrovi]